MLFCYCKLSETMCWPAYWGFMGQHIHCRSKTYIMLTVQAVVKVTFKIIFFLILKNIKIESITELVIGEWSQLLLTQCAWLLIQGELLCFQMLPVLSSRLRQAKLCLLPLLPVTQQRSYPARKKSWNIVLFKNDLQIVCEQERCNAEKVFQPGTS